MAQLGEIFDGDSIDVNAGPLHALEELRRLPHWVAWRIEMRADKDGNLKPTKPPVSAITGFGASHSKPSDWAAHDIALAFAKNKKLPGVGIVLTEDDGFTGIDLDDCRDPDTGELDLWVEDIVSLGETYGEVSPSGTGLRLIVRGKIEKTVKCDPAHVEIYRSQRYLTITGDHMIGTPDDIRPAPMTLRMLMDRVEQFQPKPAADHRPISPAILTKRSEVGNHTSLSTPPAIPYFRAVNEKALAKLSAWVPSIFATAKHQPGTNGYRVRSKDLGRSLEEDLAFTPDGIKDFGVADMGDANEGKRTAIDVVMEWRGEPSAVDAARWLCERMGVTPKVARLATRKTPS